MTNKVITGVWVQPDGIIDDPGRSRLIIVIDELGRVRQDLGGDCGMPDDIIPTLRVEAGDLVGFAAGHRFIPDAGELARAGLA